MTVLDTNTFTEVCNGIKLVHVQFSFKENNGSCHCKYFWCTRPVL